MFAVLAGGSGEGSPQLQHELIIPQWKTAESPIREKVINKINHRAYCPGKRVSPIDKTYIVEKIGNYCDVGDS